MAMETPQRIATITEFHRLRGLPGPVHPLVSVLRFEDMKHSSDHPKSWVLDFYAIALKHNFHAKLKYGQQIYDFDEGTMTFMAPGQKIGIEYESALPMEHSGWLLIFHADFLWNTPMAKRIRQYEFFDYEINEALFLSDQEETILNELMLNIGKEYQRSVDEFTQNIIIGQLEVLLAYAQRFYKRQFVTRGVSNHDVLIRLENVLNDSFQQENLVLRGIPTVVFVADALNISANYLSGLLKTLTGKSTQQHIHDKLIDVAKSRLSTTAMSVSEVAYSLGFDYPQTFSKLFKSKTQLSPAGFRQSFN